MERDAVCDASQSRSLFIGICAVGSRGIAAEKESPPIGQDEIPAHSPVRTVLGLIALDDELTSDRLGIFRDTQPDELVRRAAFDQPGNHRAIRTFYVDVEP